MKRYYPKSQTLQVGAVAVGVICLLAIRQNMGWTWNRAVRRSLPWSPLQ